MRRLQSLLSAVLIALLAVSALGQATTATIRGKVTNQNGTPLPAAEINAVNTASGFVKTVKSTADGAYILQGLTPGTYNIVVAAPGFDPKNETVTVLLGQNIEMPFQMAGTAGLNETITVVGNQLVETKTSEIATNVTTQQIENLPQDDRNFLNFAALAPGIRLSADPQRKTFAGDAQEAERTNIFIDGVSMKNDVLQGGTVGQDSSRGNPFPQSAVQEFRVITQNYSAQYDHASSAIITAVTKSGTNEFNGQAFAYYQPKQWVAAPEKNFQFNSLTSNASYKRVQPGISFGGPIVKDHLNFFVAYEGDDEHATQAVSVTIPQFASQFAQYAGNFASPFKSHLLFGKVSWQMAANQVFDFSGNYRREHETRDFGGTTSFERATDYRNWVYGATGRHQWIKNDSLNEFLVSLQTFGWNPTPKNPDLVAKRYFTPNFTTVFLTGGNTSPQEFSQRRLEFRDNYNFAPMTAYGTHSFQVGGNLDLMHYKINKSLFGTPEFKYLPDANGNYGNIPFEADFGIGNPHFQTSNNEYGIYGQDNWTVNNNLTLNLGLRWDYESHMLNLDYVTPANVVTALKGKSYQFDGRTITFDDSYFSTGNERKPYKKEFQPRLGFTYDLFANSKSVVFGGWGKFYDRLFLNSTIDELFKLQFPSYRFGFTPDGANGSTKWDPSYLSAAGLQGLVAKGNARPEVWLLNNNTAPPYSTQYNVGYRQAFGSWLGSASYNAVRAKRGISYHSGSGTCCAAFVPGLGNIIINDPAGKSYWYDAESFTLERPYTGGNRGWGARFIDTHATAESNGGPDAFALDLPTAAAYARHPIEGSEPNHFGATAIVGVPWDMRFSTSVTLSSGGAKPVFDFSKGFDFAGRSQTGVLNTAVYPPKKNGFGYRNVDFRLQKDFPSFRKGSVTALLEVFNAFNFTNYGCLSNFRAPDTNPATLGTPTCVVSLGRREQVGLKFNF
jgi:hypothetical protein